MVIDMVRQKKSAAESVQQSPEFVQFAAHDLVVDPRPLLFAHDQARLTQNPEVVRNGGLGEFKVCFDVTDAHRLTPLPENVQHLEANGMRYGLESRGRGVDDIGWR